MIITLITVIHVVVCAFIIIVVLLQSGKAGDIASVFGGAGSQAAFGARGAANLLERATTWSAVIFMITSITLSIFASRRGGFGSVLQGLKPSTTNTQPVSAPPATPATPAPATPAPPQR